MYYCHFSKVKKKSGHFFCYNYWDYCYYCYYWKTFFLLTVVPDDDLVEESFEEPCVVLAMNLQDHAHLQHPKFLLHTHLLHLRLHWVNVLWHSSFPFLYEFHDFRYSGLDLPPLPADRSDFDVHGAIDNDQVWIFLYLFTSKNTWFIAIIVIFLIKLMEFEINDIHINTISLHQVYRVSLAVKQDTNG